MTLNDPNYSKPPHFWHFVSPVISRPTCWVEMEASNLIDRLIVASASPRMANDLWKGRGQVTWTNLNFGGHQPYLWNGYSYSRRILYTGRLCKVPAEEWQITLNKTVLRVTWPIFNFKRGVVRVTWPTSNFEALSDISGTAKARIVKFCIQINCVKSWLLDDKPPLKELMYSGSHDPFLISTPAIIFRNGCSESREILYAGGIYQVLDFGWQTTR